MGEDQTIKPTSYSRKQHHKVLVEIPSDESIFNVHRLQHSAQLRLDGDGSIYFCASDDYDWQHKLASGSLPFDVFWPEWRKFCEAMEARARDLRKARA